MTVPPVLAHDLLEIASPEAILEEEPRAPWVRRSLETAPFVVVRRAAHRDGLIPVGVRGPARAERAAAWLPATAARRRLRPEDLALRPFAGVRELPALAALAPVGEAMDALGLAWGPTGSVAFELATGAPVVQPSSDLDVLVRTPEELPRERARALLAALAALPCRVDVQLETPVGAVALAEYAAGARRLVARTEAGPRLVEGPWPVGAPAGSAP